MSESRLSRSLDRAKWLSELAAALDSAHRLTLRLGQWPGSSAEAAALRSRLKAAMVEVDALRRGVPTGAGSLGPKRTRHPGFKKPRRDP